MKHETPDHLNPHGVDSRQGSLPEQDHFGIFEHYKPLLFSIAYRMLGSVADAEDKLQETFIKWRNTSLDEVRSSKAFLVTILSRLCIQHLQSAQVRREEYVGPWLPEPIYTGDALDPQETFRMQESLSMAFLLLLEKLTPVERAAFLLREVFDYGYDEVAKILSRSEDNCRQIVMRARRHVSSNRPRFDVPAEHGKRLLEAFLAASSQGDMQGLLELLASDVILYSDGGGKASAARVPIVGADRVARFLIGSVKNLVPAGVTTRLARINGQPSVIYFTPTGNPGCVLTLDIRDGRLHNIFVVTNPDKLTHIPFEGHRL